MVKTDVKLPDIGDCFYFENTTDYYRKVINIIDWDNEKYIIYGECDFINDVPFGKISVSSYKYWRKAVLGQKPYFRKLIKMK